MTVDRGKRGGAVRTDLDFRTSDAAANAAIGSRSFWSRIFNISAWHLLSAFGLRASDAAHAVIIAYTMPVSGRPILGVMSCLAKRSGHGAQSPWCW